MKIGIFGGTGAMGLAIASRLSQRHEVMIGSRQKDKAKGAASKLGRSTKGDVYPAVAQWCEVAIIAVPYGAIRSLGSLSKPLTGKLVISTINPLKMEGGLVQYASEGVSAAETLAEILPGSRIATAFNNVPVALIRKPSNEEVDVLIAADSKGTYEKAASLVREVGGLRPLYAGSLGQAESVERLTALVLNAAILTGGKRYSVRFVS